MEKEYILGEKANLARQHLDLVAGVLDPYTTKLLDAIDIQPGQRCLEIGAGSGTVARMMAERTGPSGHVIAADIDTTHLDQQPGIEVLTHNISDGAPEGGPFDVIHARLVLMHLSRRKEIFDNLLSVLKPGGWLVIGDYGALPRAISAPEGSDAESFNRVLEIAYGNAVKHGVSFDWAYEIDHTMEAAGLQRIQGLKSTHSDCGGSLEAQLSHNYAVQLEPALLAAGAEESDLKGYKDLCLHPQFRAWFYDFCYWAGQKP